MPPSRFLHPAILSFAYDNLGRVTSETNPENGTTTFQYDANSNLVSKTDSRNITTSYVYDEVDRVTQKSYSDGTPSVQYYYDSQPGDSPITIASPVGRLTKTATLTSGVAVSSYYSYCSCSVSFRQG
ncbi:MAG TPA: hypothetical protein VMG30_19570 [Acidobacteriota bacterium]|nr:hypothetical protein [Acidobacteriota bacterium]